MTDDAALVAAVAAILPADRARQIGIAVSGGGDSLALLHLAHLAARQTGHSLRAATVDHRLRKGAAAEAAMVAARCAEWGIGHDVLIWDHGGDIAGNLMAAARAARYRLLGDWAGARGIDLVALGHTADDQAEGVVMALARGAGLDGLAGMRPAWQADAVTFCRPLLAVTRQALRDHLTAQGIAWADDPTNDDDGFARTRVRKALALLAPLGVTAPAMAKSVAHLAATRAAVVHSLAQWVAAHVTTPQGMVDLDRAAFGDLHPEMQRRVLMAAVAWVTRPEHPPRGADQMRFVAAIAAGQAATLAGCRARILSRTIRLCREPRAIATRRSAPGALWDGRWQVSGPCAPDDQIAALGQAGLALRPDWRAAGMPRDALIASPALWRGGHLVAVPLLDTAQGWRAEISGDFRLFILSH